MTAHLCYQPLSARSQAHTCVSKHVHKIAWCIFTKKAQLFSLYFSPSKYKSASSIRAPSLHLLLRYALVHTGTHCITFLSLSSRCQSHISFYVHFQEFIRLSPNFAKEEKLLLRRVFGAEHKHSEDSGLGPRFILWFSLWKKKQKKKPIYLFIITF